MGNYSFPNKADDLKSRLVYTVAAEFIYRLDEYLEYEISDSEHGALPLDTIAVVMHCCEAAIDMFSGLALSWDEDASRRLEVLKMCPERLPLNSPMAAQMILETREVLGSLLPATTFPPMLDSPHPAKWQLMFTFGTEFFLELGAMTETVLKEGANEVDAYDVEMLRVFLDSVIGMVYDLSSVAWAEGQEVPARAVIAMHRHVTSCRIEDAGRKAMSLVQNVYDSVTTQVMGED